MNFASPARVLQNPIPQWALRAVHEQPGDGEFPETWEYFNLALNRRRLARWLAAFESDRDVHDFLLLDALARAFQLPVTSTGLRGFDDSLGLRPFRLWEYTWIYKCLQLSGGGLRILDIGGPSTHLSVLAALAGNSVTSIDVNPEFVQWADDVSRFLNISSYRASVADGRDLCDFNPESFDAVICCSVLEHLTAADQRVLISEATRVLRPGGLIGLTFDYGPAAPGANEHLPPPHEPPPSAAEAFKRYRVEGLEVLGNEDLDEPVPGSLFPAGPVQYTIASMFLSRRPAPMVSLPRPKSAESRIFAGLHLPAVVSRSLVAATARYQEGLKSLALEQQVQSKRQLEQDILDAHHQIESYAKDLQVSRARTEAADQRRRKAEVQVDKLRAELVALQRERDESEARATRSTVAFEKAAVALDQAVARQTTNDQEIDRLRGHLTALAGESSLKLLFRRFLARIPAPENRFTLYPVPRFFTPEAVLAVAHRWTNIFVWRYVRRSQPAAIAWPRITVVTPVYNGAAYIERAIHSVLSQNYPNLEYFIEDGGSTDSTLDIVNCYRDRLSGVTSEKDHGMYDAIGRGFERASGEILYYLNCDDVLLPGALARAGEFFARNSGVDVIYHEDAIDVNGWRFPNIAQPHVGFRSLFRGHILFQDGVFFRRSAYDRAGGVNRQMKLAGDWDLWVRMSRHSRFQRLPGHVSCFYVRSGQLSSRMNEYHAEMEARRPEILRAIGFAERTRHFVADQVLRLRNKLDRSRSTDRLFFAADFGQMPPPPGQIEEDSACAPACPISGQRPDRIVFSSRDTRFGNPLIHHIYYVPSTHLTVCHPRLADDVLNALHQTHYSCPDPAVCPPDPKYGSPYRLYRGPGLVLRFVRNILAPRALSRLFRLTWDDQTAAELLEILRAIGVDVRKPLSFLDVGCFEGRLLDDLKQRTNWSLGGVEPNPTAVQTAREKGHCVYQASALDATFVIPTAQRFDVVFLGQVIEHLPEPCEALARLSLLLKPGGKLVVTTPNLDSRQIDLFGPAWSHWHPPYHRHVFSLRSIELASERAGLKIDYSATRSYPYWTALSLHLNNMGIGAAVPHGIELPGDIKNHARSITTWSKLFWDHRGKGDSIWAVLSKES